MAKLYGGRWQLINSPRLGGGGQGEVFRAIDTSGQLQGEFALKRVINPKRHQRFVREIDAVKRLSHPNIIKLIDHSALDEGSTAEEKQFIVMPIAQGGDLSAPGRLALYKDNIDSVVQVAKQIAAALSLAHSNAIIHRDVKPQNILFTGMGHDAWLSDFGICLIRELPRVTETPEVVGPRAFLAPELEEGGGTLDVTPAADVYSLGKLIYYMLTGGVVFSRERLHEEKYSTIFSRGGRFGLLELLLRRMIAAPDGRHQDMVTVLRELEKIEGWEKTARTLPLSAEGLSSLDRLQLRSVESARVIADNVSARQQEADTLAKVKGSIMAWLQAELERVATHINSNNTLKAEVRKAHPDGMQLRPATGPNSMYNLLDGVEISLEDLGAQTGRMHALQLYFCGHSGAVVRIEAGPPGANILPARPARDQDFALLAVYRQSLSQQPTKSVALGYLSVKTAIGTTRRSVEIPGLQRPSNRQQMVRRMSMGQQEEIRIHPVMQVFGKDFTQHHQFKASEWPGNEEKLMGVLREALDTFVDIVNSHP